MLKYLIKLANHLDNKGLQKEADYLDKIIQKYAFPLPSEGDTPSQVYWITTGGPMLPDGSNSKKQKLKFNYYCTIASTAAGGREHLIPTPPYNHVEAHTAMLPPAA